MSATQTASEAKAKAYLSDMIGWIQAEQVPLFYFSAYDEPVKSAGQGHKIEQYFGLMAGNLQIHPFYKPPLSNAVIDAPDKTSLRAQPNPVKDSFSLNTPEGSRVKVFDMAGKLVLEQIYNSASVNVANLPEGAYLVTVGNASCKIIKIR
jgi:hypothetical protein